MAEFIKFTETTEGTDTRTHHLCYVNISHVIRANYDDKNRKLTLHIVGQYPPSVITDKAEIEAALTILRNH